LGSLCGKLHNYLILLGFIFVLKLGAEPWSYAQITSDTIKKSHYHSPVKAAWFSAILPGLGQVYNKKWWKLPIVYGSMGSAFFFLIHSQIEYVDARDTYRALTLPQPNPYVISAKYSGYDPFQVKSFRDYYRQNRDYAILATVGVYILQILDATVDAHLKNFDVSDKLSLHIRPSYHTSPGISLVFKMK